jgi:hypothetical protein
MKTFILLVSTIACLQTPCLRAEIKNPSQVYFQTAISDAIPGKGIKGQCLPYADYLFSRLNSLGAETYLIVYAWEDTFGYGRHCMVVYRDAKNRYWGTDNMEAKPVWLVGNTPESWVKSFERPAMKTQVVSYKKSHLLQWASVY